ncbi:hypothetical protein [Wielerella bovis]|nr:hypothetical protein [Wielerella bovis]
MIFVQKYALEQHKISLVEKLGVYSYQAADVDFECERDFQAA